jgi:hypothetical protein
VTEALESEERVGGTGTEMLRREEERVRAEIERASLFIL